MRADTAEAILRAAEEGGYYDEGIPEDEEKLIETAEFYLTHARAHAETDRADDAIKEIVRIGTEGAGYEKERETIETKPPKSPAKKKAAKREQKDEGSEEDVPETVKREHLPVPPQIEGDPPEMPFDISDCSDKQIRSLASRFQACLNRAIWQLKTTMDRTLRARQLRDAAYRRAYIAEETAAREAGLKPTKEALDLAAKGSPEYTKLDEEVFELELEISNYKALKEIYDGNIGRLSREITARDDEFKRHGGSKK